MSITERLRWAWLTGAIILIALVATAFLREHAAQPWVAGLAVVGLIGLRFLWRCPHCKMPLSAVPMAMTECKRCGNTL